MAGAINIPIGLEIDGVLNSLKAASTATTQYTNQFKEQFGSLKATAEAPVNALSQITRELAIAKRQIGDRLVVGADISPDLVTKFASLNSIVQTVKSNLGTPVSPFGDLNNRLADTRSKIQDIAAAGGEIPTELREQFQQLSAQVDGVNRALNGTPVAPFAALNAKLTETRTKIQDIVAAGGRIPTELTAELRDLESQVDQVNRSLLPVPTSMDRLVSTGDKLQAFGRTASLVSAGIVLLAGASFQSYAKINSLQLGLEGVTGSAAAAKEEFRQLLPIVRLPGLGLEEAVKGDVRLQAIGFSAREAQKDIAEIGNAIALTGGGKFELDSVLTQFTQMAGKAKVLSEDLKPILTSSPAIAKAVKDLFGTVDSEQISAKLQAAGRGPKDFINDLVIQLSKLERVKGGPANALENLGDSVKLAQFQIGEAADKSFGLTSKINTLGDVVGSAATAFAEASPFVQTLGLGFVGLAATIPPVVLGLGTLIKLAPIAAEGFAGIKTALLALATPIGVIGTVAAVIAALGIAIYATNQPLIEMVDKTKLLNQLNEEAARSIEAERSQVDRLLVTARNEQISKQTRIQAIKDLNALSPEYLGNLSIENINSAQAADAIRKHAQAIDIRARARASEDKLVELYKKRDEVAATPTKDFERPFGVFAEAVAPGQKPKALNFKAKVAEQAKADKDAALKSIDDNIQDVLKSQELQKARAVKFNVKLEPVNNQSFDYSGLDLTKESDLKKVKDRMKELREKIFEGQRDKTDVSGLITEYKTLKAQVDATNKSLKTPKPKSEEDPGTLKVLQRIRGNIETQMQEIRASGKEVANDLKIELLNVDNQIARIQGKDTRLKFKASGEDLIQANLNSEGERIAKFGTIVKKTFDDIKQYGSLGFYREEIDKIQNQIEKLSLKNLAVPKETIDTLAAYRAEVEKANNATRIADRKAEKRRTDGLPHFDIGSTTYEGEVVPLIRFFDDTKATLEERLDGLNGSISGALQQASAGMAVGFGELIGGMIAGTASLSDFPALIGGIFGDLAKSLGQALIAFGTGGLALETFLSNPVTAIAAGIGLVALGTALRASMQASVNSTRSKGVKGYESGGLFLGESFIRVGETSKARAGGGEFVAPVTLGADLISKRILRNLSTNIYRPDQSKVNQGRQIGISVSGQFELRNDRLVAAVETELGASGRRSGRDAGIMFKSY